MAGPLTIGNVQQKSPVDVSTGLFTCSPVKPNYYFGGIGAPGPTPGGGSPGAGPPGGGGGGGGGGAPGPPGPTPGPPFGSFFAGGLSTPNRSVPKYMFSEICGNPASLRIFNTTTDSSLL